MKKNLLLFVCLLLASSFKTHAQCSSTGTPQWNPLPATSATSGSLTYPPTAAVGSVSIVSGGTTTFFPTASGSGSTNPVSFNKSASGTATITFNINVYKSSVGESFKLTSIGTSEGQSITATDATNATVYPVWMTTTSATIGGTNNNEITGTGSNGASEFSFSVAIKSLTIGPKSGVTATSGVTVNFQTICDGTIIPVSLMSFKAVEKNGQAQLLWQTASEKNNAGFEVQRSFDAQTWQNIGFVKGHGQSSSMQTYQFEDAGPLSILGYSVVYYRLRQIDFDQTAIFSPIESVKASKAVKGFTLYPNPVYNKTATLVLYVAPQEGDMLQIMNAFGAVVKTETIKNPTQTLDLSQLTEGVYFLDFKNKNSHFVQKMVVAH